MSDTGRDLPVNFSSFVISLASSAMTHLGEAAHPETGQSEVMLPLAKNTIDLLALFQEKTEGNLDEDEKKLLETLVYELRMKYVEKSKT